MRFCILHKPMGGLEPPAPPPLATLLPVTGLRQTLTIDDLHTFHSNDNFMIGEIRTNLGVSDDSMFLWISSNSCPLNLLLIRNHQATIIIVKRLIQERDNVTRVGVVVKNLKQYSIKQYSNDNYVVCQCSSIFLMVHTAYPYNF